MPLRVGQIESIGHVHRRRWTKEIRIESLDEALKLIAVLRNKATDRVRCGLEEFPDLRQCTHESMAEFLGISRETISRYYGMEVRKARQNAIAKSRSKLHTKGIA